MAITTHEVSNEVIPGPSTERSKPLSELLPFRQSSLAEFRERFGPAFLVYYDIGDVTDQLFFSKQTDDAEARAPAARAELRWHAIRSTGRSVFRSFISVGSAQNNDIVLEHASVSKLHAVFRLDEHERLLIHDARSRNGTFVNDVRVAAEASQAREVQSGTQIRFGSLPMILFDAEAMLAMLGRQ